jgi:mannose-6-phosphate isomerase-like protein (cupin superfamily)
MKRLAAILCVASGVAAADTPDAHVRSFVQAEGEIAITQSGPHEGAGTTTAFPFFEHEPGLGFVFRKRLLHPGSSIGPHRNDKDEVYYVISGRGELMLEGEVSEVGPGDAVLTRDGHAHALRQLGDEDLVILIVYPRPDAPR